MRLRIGRGLHFGLLRYFRRKGFGVQSPWAYELVRDVLFESLPYYHFIALNAVGKELCGTRYASRRKADEQLFRLSNYLRPASILQLGTETGVSMLYLSASHPSTPSVGITGRLTDRLGGVASRYALRIEERDLSAFDVKEVEDTLPDLLHICEGVPEKVVESCLKAMLDKAVEGSGCGAGSEKLGVAKNHVHVIILEGIDRKRRRVWKSAVLDSAVPITMDLGRRGIIFLDYKRQKQNYKL